MEGRGGGSNGFGGQRPGEEVNQKTLGRDWALVPVHPLHSWTTGINGLVYSGPQIIGREHHGQGLPETARHFPSDRHSLETPVHVRSDPQLPGEDSTVLTWTIPGSFAPPTRPDLTLSSLTQCVYGACNLCQA